MSSLLSAIQRSEPSLLVVAATFLLPAVLVGAAVGRVSAAVAGVVLAGWFAWAAKLAAQSGLSPGLHG